MTLYRKYRPQKISELDLTSVREQLSKIVASKNIPHAFLFSGPKGTGKTSAARILAKVINCMNPLVGGEPCNKCEQCLSITKGTNIDVVEMDAASHRGIDDIRTLRENVNLAPSTATKKVYIIDEVHMLTNEAANAFLKTLEEPPNHVIFILATTNPEKLPETIHSRLTNVFFTKATGEEIGRQLERVIKGEKIDIEKAALETIAKASDGSFRDAVKILEQLSFGNKKIIKAGAEEFLFQNKLLQIDELLDCILEKDFKAAIDHVEKIAQKGGSIKLLVDGLIARLHEKLLQNENSDFLEMLLLAKRDLAITPIAQLPLELAIAKWCDKSARIATQSVARLPDTGTVGQAGGEETKKVEAIKIAEGEISNEVWQKIMTTARSKNASIEALLRAAKPIGFDGKIFQIGVYYSFHKEKLENGSNTKLLEGILDSVLGTHVRISCSLVQRQEKAEVKKEVIKPHDILTETQDPDIIKAAKEIFGDV